MKQINVTETMEDVDTDKKPEKENDEVDKIDNKENKGPATKKPNMTKKKAVSETDEDETEEAKELKIINKMLKFMQEDVEENLRVAKENRDTVDNKRKAAREKIRKLRVEMNAFFNKLEQTLDKTIEQTRSDDLQKMMILTSECQTLADKIKGLTDDIGKSLEDKKPCGQICNMNKVRQDMKDFDTTIRRVCQDNHVQEYVFERSSDIVNMFKTITELGYLNCDVEKKKTVLKYSEVDINAKAENEKLIPLLAGMTFVSDDQLVAADYENRCIKLINTKTHQLDCKFPVSSEPWDVTSTKSGQIAMTLPMKKRIQYLTVQNSSIFMGKDFSTNGECRGIDCKLKQLFVTYVSPGKVEILDMKGTVLKCFASTNSETGLFKWPGYISVTTEPKQWIYVTDKERDTVTRMTYDGQIDESFFGQSMKGPRGVAIDDKGCVFVCGRNSNTLCQILFKTKNVEKLLQRGDGLKQPHCLMWHMNRVYISTCGGQFLRSWEVV